MKKPVGRPKLSPGKDSLRVGFTLTKEQKRELSKIAKTEGVTFSELVRRVLSQYLTGELKKPCWMASCYHRKQEG